MKIIFCTTCKGRLQHLQQTLPVNLTDNNGFVDAAFLVLDYNSKDGLSEYLRTHEAAIDAGHLIVYRFTEPIPFRMAHAKNLAHRLGMREGADILVNLDADNFICPDFGKYVHDRFHSNPNAFLWSRMIKDGEGRLPRGISGRIAVSSKAFLISGGYDEVFRSWSPDDKDFNCRLTRLGYRDEEIPPSFLKAIPHNDKMRFRDYPEVQYSQNGEDFELAGREELTIANFGKIGQGVVYRNANPSPIELQGVATRIFGIGLHKTSTTSLHHALGHLGLESAHWKTAHWAKAIWEEMMQGGRSRTLEQSYALSDLPIPLLFRELDKAYPNSKFILTLRHEEDWIQSVRNHWGQRNKFRQQWDSDPFTHKVHRLLYGQRWFDREVFLRRYRQHNAEVLDYFKDRPHDLLVMDMSNGAGWYELCGFLRQPIPSIPYPRAMVT